ncbi:MAG: hypothetical protein AAF434_01605 [Pseudomonadota bacterium]
MKLPRNSAVIGFFCAFVVAGCGGGGGSGTDDTNPPAELPVMIDSFLTGTWRGNCGFGTDGRSYFYNVSYRADGTWSHRFDYFDSQFCGSIVSSDDRLFLQNGTYRIEDEVIDDDGYVTLEGVHWSDDTFDDPFGIDNPGLTRLRQDFSTGVEQLCVPAGTGTHINFVGYQGSNFPPYTSASDIDYDRCLTKLSDDSGLSNAAHTWVGTLESTDVTCDAEIVMRILQISDDLSGWAIVNRTDGSCDTPNSTLRGSVSRDSVSFASLTYNFSMTISDDGRTMSGTYISSDAGGTGTVSLTRR